MAQTTTGEAGTTGQPGTAGDLPDIEACIESCSLCHRVCLETIQHSLRMGGQFASADHVLVLADCEQICQVSADFMMRGSRRHEITCGACAEICRDCAQSCRVLGGPEMDRCAEICDRCAESCAAMVGVTH